MNLHVRLMTIGLFTAATAACGARSALLSADSTSSSSSGGGGSSVSSGCTTFASQEDCTVGCLVAIVNAIPLCPGAPATDNWCAFQACASAMCNQADACADFVNGTDPLSLGSDGCTGCLDTNCLNAFLACMET